MARADRRYDVVVWGATGFTGRLIAEHLAETYGTADLDWAVAGRDREALDGLRHRLADIDPDCASLDVRLGRVGDRVSLDAIAEQTEVVCAAVGPYARYGTPMVEACLEAGTDYCDLAGEVQWLRRLVDEHHGTARQRGVRLVHACGFDSVPSDLGTLLVQEAARERFDAPCDEVATYVRADSFGFSGGTLAATVEAARAMDEDPALARVFADPLSLTGEDADRRVAGSPKTPAYDDDLGSWTAPFEMASINEKVVHRSNALLDRAYGESFSYRETSPTGDGVAGAARAYGLAAGLALYDRLLSVGPVRELLARYVLPGPGAGPSRETIESGSFEFRLVGRRPPGADAEGDRVEARVAAPRDPYGATGWMAGEAAVCLARGEAEAALDGGVLTPATGLGRPLVDRLEDVGMTFEVRAPDAPGG